jgi:hypothetical protein
MTMQAEFRSLLTGDAALMALVPVASVVFGDFPQGLPYPCVVCDMASGENDVTHDGPTGLFQGRVQVDCYANDYSNVRAIADRVVTVLNGYRGGSFGGIFHRNDYGRREGATNEADRPYRVILDFEVNWRKP